MVSHKIPKCKLPYVFLKSTQANSGVSLKREVFQTDALFLEES